MDADLTNDSLSDYKMIRAYRYVFYTFCRWNSRWDRKGIAQMNAFLLMVVVTWWNVGLLLTIVESCLRAPLLPKLSVTQVICGMAGLAVPLYVFLLGNSKAREIAAQFQKESPRQRRIRGVMVSIYFVLSYVLVVVGAIVRSKMLYH